MEIEADDDRSGLLWVADVAPDEAAAPVGELMLLGAEAIRPTLERRADR